MLLPSPTTSGQPANLTELTTVTHEGKVLIFAAERTAGQGANLYYTVRRDGFEDRTSSAPAQLDNWENWKPLPFLEENGDASVLANEAKTLAVLVNAPDPTPDWVTIAPRPVGAGATQIYQSVYSGSLGLTASGAVQAISALGCIYTFRKSSRNTVLVDRYVLDGLTNTLIRKLDVRFRRSRQRLAPLTPDQASTQDVIDGLDYRDANGQPFYEPATELNFLAGSYEDEDFAVVFADTAQPNENRWHFFGVKNGVTGTLRLTSVRVSKDGLFDVTDRDGSPGIQRRTIHLVDQNSQAVAINGAPAATIYNRQKLAASSTNPQPLLRDSVHVMLALPTASGIVAVSLAVTADGTLAQLADDSSATTAVVHSEVEEVTLPPSSLQEVSLLDPQAPAAKGSISAITRTADGNTVLTLDSDPGSGTIPTHGTIQIDGSGGYDGHYSAAPVSLGTTAQVLSATDLTLKLAQPLPQAMPSGSRIRVNVPVVTGIGGATGPFEVQLTQDAVAGALTVAIAAGHPNAAQGTPAFAVDFVDIDPPEAQPLGTWAQVPASNGQAAAGGHAIDMVAAANGKLRMRSQGATVTSGEAIQISGAQSLDGVHTFVKTGSRTIQLTDPWDGGELTEIQTAGRTGLQFRGAVDSIRVAPGAFSLSGSFTIEMWVKTASQDDVLLSIGTKALSIRGGKLAFSLTPASSGTRPVADDKFHHVAVTFDASSKSLTYYVDGQQDAVTTASNTADAPNTAIFFAPALPGTLSELRVWETALSRQDLVNAMLSSLTGREDGLAGYWRLTSIVEGSPRTVTDFSAGANHGVVNGDPFVSDAVLSRDLGNGRKAAGFASTQFFSVESGTTYEESFEFQLDDGSQPAPARPFDFEIFGKAGADSFAIQEIATEGDPNFIAPTAATFGKASARFIVPDGVAVVRAFGIKNAQGNWTELHVRNHRVRAVIGPVTDSLITETIKVPASSLGLATAATLRSTYEGLEVSEQLLETGQATAAELIENAQGLFAKLADPSNFWCQLGVGGSQAGQLTIGPAVDQVHALNLTTTGTATLLRFEPVTNGSLTQDRDIVRSGGTVAIVAAGNCDPTEVHSLFLDLTQDLASSELPPLALDSSKGATPLLDEATIRARLSTTNPGVTHRDKFDQQQAAHASTVTLGVTSTQLWQVKPVTPEGKIVISTTGQADLSRPFTWSCNIGAPDNQPGDQTFLQASGGVLKVGTVTDLLLSVPSFDVSPVAVGEAPRAGRPLNSTIQKSLVAIQKSLDEVLKQLADLGFSGVDPKAKPPADQLKDLQKALAGAAKSYLDQRSTLSTAVSEVAVTPAGSPRITVTTLGPAPSTNCRLHLVDSANGQVELTFLERETLSLKTLGGAQERTNIELRQLIFNTTEPGAWSLKPLPACLDLQGQKLNIQGGAELPGDWTAECWSFVRGESLTTTFLQLSGPRGGTITLPGFGLQAAFPVTATSGPSIVSVTPATSGALDNSGKITIAGASTHFTQGNPVVTFSRKGVTASALEIVDDTHLSVTLKITSQPEAGACDVTVTTGAEKATGKALFSVTPALASMAPASGKKGETLTAVKIQGVGTHFDKDRTHVTVSKAGVTPSQVTVVDTTNLTLTIKIDSNAAPGPVDVTVATGNESATAAGLFLIGTGAAPTLGMVPDSGQRGQVLPNVLFTGQGTHFTAASPSIVFDDPKITASFIQVLDDTHLTATIKIDAHADIGPGSVTVAAGSETATAAFTVSFISVGWHHFAIVSSATGGAPGQTTFYLDGVPVGSAALAISGQVSQLGAASKLAEVRIWNAALSDEEVEANYLAGITGHEPGLVGYYPMDGSLANLARNLPANHLVSVGSLDLKKATLPFPAGAGRLRESADIVSTVAVSAEYATYAVDPATGQNTAWLRRLFAVPGKSGTHLISQKRVEELELIWVGNAQFAPTLLGYIEGAPPVPSENLTVSPDSYAGATSVTLSQSDEVEYSWSQSKESKLGADFDFFLGVETEILEGAAALEFFGVKALDVKLGAKGALSLSRSQTADSTVSASVTISSTDRIELRGHVEADPAIPQLGARFLPKNVGYALVVSALADVFVTRLKETQRMVSYTVTPTPDVPPQINTITFLIDPAYTLNGTVDGQVGTHAADERFYRNVPAMRARQGALFPASYMRLREALDLQRQIQQQDKQRESFFVNFDTSLAFGIGDQEDLVAAAIDKPGADSVSVGLPSASAGRGASSDQQQAKLDDISDKLDGITAQLQSQQDQQTQLAQSKKDEIQKQLQDPQSQVHALRSFAAWQQKMEDLRAKAGKHNIVNAYVWDADGGFRTDTQEFANTIEHTIGSSVSYDASLGLSLELGIGVIKTELNAAANIGMTQTLTKTVTSTNTLSLEVDASGVEGLGVTDDRGLPLAPGDKVERYRFLTFYLEPSTSHFNDFFNQVVDPEWLASNDEDARALRQTRAGKPNAAWRVLHRVTFVERPALAGFGRDLRPVATPEAPEFSLEQAVRALQEENRALKTQLDEVLALLRPRAAGAAG